MYPAVQLGWLWQARPHCKPTIRRSPALFVDKKRAVVDLPVANTPVLTNVEVEDMADIFLGMDES
jgi:hypothetical protein